jgi:mannose-6-phosphate isomerase-like protein (cupin superfamily)
VLPGVTTEWHSVRNIDERYVIVSGKGKVEVGDLQPTLVFESDVVHIPANTPQRITNVGDADLVFLCVCSPRFVQSAYVSGR